MSKIINRKPKVKIACTKEEEFKSAKIACTKAEPCTKAVCTKAVGTVIHFSTMGDLNRSIGDYLQDLYYSDSEEEPEGSSEEDEPGLDEPEDLEDPVDEQEDGYTLHEVTQR